MLFHFHLGKVLRYVRMSVTFKCNTYSKLGVATVRKYVLNFVVVDDSLDKPVRAYTSSSYYYYY